MFVNRYVFALIISFCSFSCLLSQPLDTLQLRFSAEILFDFGKYDLRPGTDTTFQEVLAFFQDSEADIKIKITAHTDSIGSIEANQKLSEKRGNTVAQYLINKGIDAQSIELAVFGEENPIAENKNEEGRQLNRRATIAIWERIPHTYVEGQITDKDTGEGIVADIIIHGKTLRDSFQTNPEGYFRRAVPENVVIGVDIFAQGYFYETKMLKTKPGLIPDLSFELPKVKEGESIDIKNLYFVGNKAILLARSKPELPKILKFMEINDTITVEIGGHVNVPNTPPDKIAVWNHLLSINRAKLVYDYLVSRGIDEDRLRFKGYGNSKMRYPKGGTEWQQEMNRRVEIKILHSGKIASAEEVIDKKIKPVEQEPN